jgi:CubicO group peptidase (beta-lactamase class C family)
MWVRVAVGLSAVLLTACTTSPAVPTAAPDVPFPTKDWTRGEWPAGVGHDVLDRIVDETFAGGAARRVRSVAIVHKGRLVYERYSPNPADGADLTMPSFSVAKSLTSAAAGTLARQGKLDVHAPVAAPEWAAAGDPRHAITADNLLRLTSGLQWNEGTDLGESGRTRDEAHYAADKPLTAPPGSTFNYNTDSACILARAMATALGGPGQFTRFVGTELFDKLGMRVTLTYDDHGTWLGGYAASARTLDYAKLGLLYLRDGVWAGERILPAGWVDYTRTPTPANHGYGAGWWLDPTHPGVFSALGAHGQVVTVDPAHDLTFVITSADGDSAAVTAAILDAFGG